MATQPVPQNLSPQHLVTLYEISGVMNSSLEFDDALSNVINAIMQVTKAQRGFLMIADNDTNQLEVLVSHGIDGETIEQEGYSTTIVNQVVTTREPLLTNNAQFDTRFAPGQSIIMRGLRAILCAPMMVQNRLVGVVYVDTAMRSGNFTEADRDLLNAVAGQAGRAIENARLYRVAVIKGRLERELQMASEIQRGLLPHRLPDVPGYEVAPHWQAAREVAGDFYDAFKLDDNTFGTVIADVSDKGAPAALFMAVARTLIRSHANAGLGASETIGRTNNQILDDAESGGMFVTVYHSLFNVAGQSIHVNAGHNPPVVYRRATHEAIFMPTGGRAVGWFPDIPLEEIQLQLQPGDVIVYYTDGLTEAENPQGDFYGEDRLAAAILEIAADHSAKEILQHIIASVDAFCDGALPFDDLTMMIVRYTG
jgi:serine phosphatase RsbU (regulator of sigma subunit)